MTDINPLCVDLSHWDPADDYEAASDAGIVSVIYKATEGQSYTDPTYVEQQRAAKLAGLAWGAYHFGDASNIDGQISNFMRFAAPDPDELFCFDWEDNGGDTTDVEDVVRWIEGVEDRLGRPGQCVLYGGNTIKERADAHPVLTARRLWLCQYGPTPELPSGFSKYFLWQYTDGQYGPSPHSIDGIGHCDVNHYDGTPDELIAQWATGQADIPQPPPIDPDTIVNILVAEPPGVTLKIRQIATGVVRDRHHGRRRHG